jgi:serine/threonine protein kinase
MPYCLNPNCQVPENTTDGVCQSCGTELTLHDRYQALKPIGQGGFGRTFLAVDLSQPLKPRCAIKQLYPRQQGVELQEKASEQFRQEAQQLAVLGHYPSMPRFLNYFEQDGYQYLVQEFIEGQNLAEVVAEGRIFTEAEVRDLLETVLETIDFLHHRQIIHRDIKPANIIQTPNRRFVLVDLGAAKVLTGTTLGQTGTVIGSAEYVAPEQLRGKAVFASDLYSLGATCVTMLTGMSPFSLFDTSTGAWEWRDYLAGPVGDRLGKILDRMLLGPTKQRYSSAEEVLRDLVGERSVVRENVAIGDRQREAFVETDGAQTALEIDMAQAGKIAEKGDRSSPTRKSILLLGGLFMFPIGLLIFATITSTQPAPQSPAVSMPVEPTPIQPSYPSPIDLPDELIKPTYTRIVQPFKTFNNIPPFSMMAFKSNSSTIVTGLLEQQINSGYQSNLKVNLLDIETTKTSTLSFQANEWFSNNESFMYIKQDNLFIQSSNQNGTSKQINIFNLRTNSIVKLPELLTGNDVNSIRGESLLFEGGDKDFLWKITPNGELIKTNLLLNKFAKSYNYVASTTKIDNADLMFSDNDKYLFKWEYIANRKIEFINIDTGTSEGNLSVPKDIVLGFEDINSPTASTETSESIFFVTPIGQGSIPISTDDSYVKQSAYLPNAHKNDTRNLKQQMGSNGEKIKGFTYNVAIAVWDVKQKNFLYYIPRQYKPGRIKLSPDARTMAILEYDSIRAHRCKISVWDLPTGRLFREINIPMPPPNVEFSRPRMTLEFTSDSKTLVLGVGDLWLDSKLQEKPIADISLWNVEELRKP